MRRHHNSCLVRTEFLRFLKYIICCSWEALVHVHQVFFTSIVLLQNVLSSKFNWKKKKKGIKNSPMRAELPLSTQGLTFIFLFSLSGAQMISANGENLNEKNYLWRERDFNKTAYFIISRNVFFENSPFFFFFFLWVK